MNTAQKEINISVLEDSNFYNSIITRQLEIFTSEIKNTKDYKFRIESFLYPEDFIRNLRNPLDIAVVDYYLGNGFTGSQIIKQIKDKKPDCHVIIISQHESLRTSIGPLILGACEFIHKDRNFLDKLNTCLSAILTDNYFNKTK